MVQEVLKHGKLLNVEALSHDNGVVGAGIAVTKNNFDPSDPAARPPAWRATRLKRVLAKEDTLRSLGIDEETILLSRPAKVLEVKRVCQMICICIFLCFEFSFLLGISFLRE
jgi:hypothetical protein